MRRSRHAGRWRVLRCRTQAMWTDSTSNRPGRSIASGHRSQSLASASVGLLRYAELRLPPHKKLAVAATWAAVAAMNNSAPEPPPMLAPL